MFIVIDDDPNLWKANTNNGHSSKLSSIEIIEQYSITAVLLITGGSNNGSVLPDNLGVDLEDM